MRLKMNYQQASYLKEVLRVTLTETDEDLHDKLHRLIVYKIYARLRSKVELSATKDYSITLTDIEAIAWELFWLNRTLDPRYLYEQNLINAQVARIDKQYA